MICGGRMNTDKLVRVGFVAAVLGIGGYIYHEVQQSNEQQAAALAVQQKVDANIVARLKRILGITVAAIISTEAKAKTVSSGNDKKELAEASFGYFLGQLETGYNAAKPPLISGQLGVGSTKAATVVAYHDINKNGKWDAGLDTRNFSIEIDGQRGRVIATDIASGTIHDQVFTQQQQRAGGGLMTGFLIGHMMNSQSSYGNPNQVQNKQRTSPSRARTQARNRAGSGSHTRGK